MRKKDFSKYFKTVVLMLGLIFFTVQAVQANPAVKDDLTVESNENDGVGGVGAAGQKTLDGSTDVIDVAHEEGDTLEIKVGGEIRTGDNIAVEIKNDDNTLINNGLIETTGSFTGIDSDGNDNTITNEVDGTIDTEGGYGIYSDGDNVNITNNGRIETEGGTGIHSEGDNVNITNGEKGTISTALSHAHGIYSDGQDTSDSNVTGITNYGLISTNGTRAFGIYSYSDLSLLTESDYAIIKNFGRIETLGQGAHGIRAQGINSFINNEVGGEISTMDEYAYGIFIIDEGHTIVNDGKILTAGHKAHGIYAVDAYNAKITNNWEIKTTGYGAAGIYSLGTDYAEITNNNLISTMNEMARGIESQGDFVEIINNGRIETEKHGAAGIWSTGDNVNIINNNLIETKDAHAEGIFSDGDNVTIDNYSSIISGWDGIYSRGNNNTINNRFGGTIRVTGNDAVGIEINSKLSENNIMNNYGLISALGLDSYAIRGGVGKETLNLFCTSDITGDIDLGSGDDTINAYCGSKVDGDINLGPGDDTMTIYKGATIKGAIDFDEGEDTLKVQCGNYALTFKDLDNNKEDPEPEDYIIEPSLISIKCDDTTLIVDTTCQGAKSAVLSDFTSGLHGVLRKRLNHIKPEHIKLAALRIEPGMLAKPKQPQVWGDMFHSYRKREDDGRVAAYDNRYSGFSGGFERNFERLRLGVLAGYANAVTESDNKTFETKSYSYFTGTYAQYDFARFKLRASLIGGYEDHNNERYVTDNMFGAETARADFGSIFLSPSVTLLTEYRVAERLVLRPSATMKYSAGWYDSYQEHGTTRSNIEMDSRIIQTLNPEVQLGVVYEITQWCEFELSAGGMARFTDDGSIDGRIGSSDFRFAESGDDNVYGAQVGAYLGADVTDKLQLYVNAQFSDATGGETQETFMAGLEYSF